VKPPATVVPHSGALRSVSVVLVGDAEELRAELERVAPGQARLVQPFIAGSLYAVCGVAWKGQAVCTFHQRSPRVWPPLVGGSSYAVAVRRDVELDRAVRELMHALRWDGIFCVQFLRDEAGSRLIDVNPRVYGSLALAIAAGYNLPAIWADLLLGRQPVIGPLREAVRFRAEEDDLRAILWELRTRGRPRAMFGLVPRPGTIHPVWSWRDPRPVLTTLHKLPRRMRRSR